VDSSFLSDQTSSSPSVAAIGPKLDIIQFFPLSERLSKQLGRTKRETQVPACAPKRGSCWLPRKKTRATTGHGCLKRLNVSEGLWPRA
jgi:hypothetical protein